MTADKAPRRWWIDDNEANRYVPPDHLKRRYLEVLEYSAYVALAAELEREKRKVEKLNEIRRHHAWHIEDCLCESSYDDQDCDCGFEKRVAELEAINKQES
jgi:hypothetical protein